MADFNLQRFIDAQALVFEQVVAELKAGQKASHWIWFIFPQIIGLGHSSTAQYFGITSLAEATAYLDNDVLGLRLRYCTAVANQIAGRSAHDIFGSPDDLKFRSSMTLFKHATPDNGAFIEALNRYYDGIDDPATLRLLKSS